MNTQPNFEKYTEADVATDKAIKARSSRSRHDVSKGAEKQIAFAPGTIRTADLMRYDLVALAQFYWTVRECLDALGNLTEPGHCAEDMSPLVDRRLVAPLFGALKACVEAIKATQPEGRYGRERRAALLFQHAVDYDTPDAQTTSFLLEGLAAVASEPHHEQLDRTIVKELESIK